MELRPFTETFTEAIDRMPEFRSQPLQDLYAKYGVDHFHRLAYNESAYGPSPKVVEAMRAAAPNVGMYPSMRDDGLRHKLADLYQRGLTPQHFYTGCSGYETLEMAGRAFLRPGDEIIIMPPTFGVYNRIALFQGCSVKEVPLDPTTYTPDVDALLKAITPQTRAIVLCNPNNPTGTVMTQAQMDQLMNNVPAHVLIISDEVYFHFVRDEQFPDSLQYVLDGKNIIVVHTFSKGYGLAGMRIGYAIAPPKIASFARKFYRGFHLNALQLAAAMTALDDPLHLQKNVQAGIEGREFFYEHCDRLDLHYWESQTNFVLMELPCPANDVVEKMMYHGVMVRAIGNLPPNYLRVSVGTPEANAACVNALEAALQEVMAS